MSQTSDQLPYESTGQSLRRPGWGLMEDVHPRRKYHRGAPMHPEHQQPIAPVVFRNSDSKQTKIDSRSQRLLRWLQKHAFIVTSPLIVILSMRLSTLPIIGEGIIIAYGLVVFVRRVPSYISFWLATVVLASIGTEFLFLPGVGRANNSTLFVFLLLSLGLASSMLETRRMVRRDKALRRR